MTDTKHPKIQFKNGSLKSAIWENKTEKNGQTVLQSTVSIQKSYKDPKSGEWVNCELHLLPSEIPQLLSVAQAAYTECSVKRTEE